MYVLKEFKRLGFKEAYGDKLDSAKIYVNKMYTSEDVKDFPELENVNLKDGDIAFEATIYFLPAEGADPNEFTIPNGEYDEESGWIQDAFRLGVLRKNDSGDEKYKITDFGTGW